MMKIIGDGGHAKVVRELIVALVYSYTDAFAFIAVGDNRDRRKEAELAEAAGCRFPILIHTSATVSASAHIGHGTVVMAGAVVQAGAVIGSHCIINTSASVDHDCVLDDYVHVGPGAHLCGDVHVGEGVLFGVGSRALPGAMVQEWQTVKAGDTAR